MPTALTLLGPPQVAHESVVLHIPAERRCQLLLVLALRRSWVARDELAALLWPAHRAERAAANLRKALHLARELPWAEALQTQGGVLRFAIDTDVHEVERAAREGRIAEALALCRGPLLDGMDDAVNAAWTEWLGAERAQHERRVQRLLRARLAQLAGQPQEALALARRVLEADPLDEDAVVALLAAQRQLGLVQAQRASFRDFSVRLHDELGVEPSLRVRAQLRDEQRARRHDEPSDQPYDPPRDERHDMSRDQPHHTHPAATGVALDGSVVVTGAAMAAVVPGPAEPGLLGRQRELDQIGALLGRDDCRLLTITGPGGAGKSALLKHVLRRLEGRFADGALWIALDDLRDVVQVSARIAVELGLAPHPQQQDLAAICVHLATRRVLLALDNAEHLPALAGVVLRLLEAAPGLKVCVSSRVRLAAAGEWLFALGGLAVASAQAGAQEILNGDAARLFVATATAARPDFDAAAQAVAIGALVRAVGGLPLALLLAADWVRLLPVAEIGRELEHSLDVLDSGAEEGEERPEHHSVRATFERSWQMLSAREQRALAELSVFVGGFTRQAAHDVAGAALVLLAALADKSLLQMPQMPDLERCSLHPLIRRFAFAKLDAAGLQEAERRHADCFLGELAHIDREVMKGELRALDRIDADLENCRSAWRWAVAQRESDRIAACAIALMRYFEVRGRTLEGLELLSDAHAALCSAPDVPPLCAAHLCAAIAQLHVRLHRFDEAAEWARRGITHARAASAPARIALALCLSVLGLCRHADGEYPQAKRFFEQAIRHARAAADLRTATAVQGNLAMVLAALGEYDASRRLMLELLARRREWGDWIQVASLLNNLAALHVANGEWQQARSCAEEGIAVTQAHGILQPQPNLFVNRAVVSLQLCSDAEAELAAREALEIARVFVNRGAEAQALILLAQLAARRHETAAAREHLQDALACPPMPNNPPLQLDWLFAYASLRAAEGETSSAADVLCWMLARPDIEPVERARAQALLAGLRIESTDPADAAEPNAALPERLRQAAAELATGLPSILGAERRGTSGS